MKIISLSGIFLFCVFCIACNRNEPQPADYVNPFIGASTGTEAAGINHGKEIINSAFDQVHDEVRTAWNEALSKVVITGGT